jgi:chemotaxis protein CheD
MYRIVGIGEFIISNDSADILKTFALASCIGLTMYSPSRKVLGMAHIALPYSLNNCGDNAYQPAYFADLAVPLLLKKLSLDYGCSKHELIVHLFGGAQSIRETDFFQIGLRNSTAVKQILSANHLSYHDGETGGTNSRTISMDVAKGNVKIDFQPLKI